MKPLITYHNDPAFKARFVAELQDHQDMDRLVRGTYSRMNAEWHGCAIGCSLRSLNRLQGHPDALDNLDQHKRFPVELGWPLWLAYVEDHLFECLPHALAQTWPLRLARAIPVGVTIGDIILARLLRWMLVDHIYGCVHATGVCDVRIAIRQMATLFDRTISGEEVAEDEWSLAATRADLIVASTARVAWAVRAARADRADRAARADRADRAARADRAVRAAVAARAAWGDWAARDSRAIGDAFYPALSDEVLRLVATVSEDVVVDPRM